MIQFEQDRINETAKVSSSETLQEHKMVNRTQDRLICVLETNNLSKVKELENGWLKIKRNGLVGIVDSSGEIILEPLYRHFRIADTKELFTVENKDYKYGIIDKHGNVVVPLGKYLFICQLERGFTRVRTINGDWAIIDQSGYEIVGGFDEIWGFNEKYDSFVVKKEGRRYSISIEALETLRLSIINSDGKVTPQTILNYLPTLQGNFHRRNLLTLSDYM